MALADWQPVRFDPDDLTDEQVTLEALVWGTPTPSFFELLTDRRPAWMADAACKGHDPALFFPDRGESTEAAKRLCDGCPVARECRDYAEAQGASLQGVWGGVSQRQRRRPRRRAA